MVNNKRKTQIWEKWVNRSADISDDSTSSKDIFSTESIKEDKSIKKIKKKIAFEEMLPEPLCGMV